MNQLLTWKTADTSSLWVHGVDTCVPGPTPTISPALPGLPLCIRMLFTYLFPSSPQLLPLFSPPPPSLSLPHLVFDPVNSYSPCRTCPEHTPSWRLASPWAERALPGASWPPYSTAPVLWNSASGLGASGGRALSYPSLCQEHPVQGLSSQGVPCALAEWQNITEYWALVNVLAPFCT